MHHTSAVQPKPNSRPSPRLKAAFLFVSAARSVVLLAVRNLSDDEISPPHILAPVHEIIQYTATRRRRTAGVESAVCLTFMDDPF